MALLVNKLCTLAHKASFTQEYMLQCSLANEETRTQHKPPSCHTWWVVDSMENENSALGIADGSGVATSSGVPVALAPGGLKGGVSAEVSLRPCTAVV